MAHFEIPAYLAARSTVDLAARAVLVDLTVVARRHPPLTRLATQIGAEHRHRTLPWTRDTRVLLASGYDAYVAALEAYRGPWNAAVATLALSGATWQGKLTYTWTVQPFQTADSVPRELPRLRAQVAATLEHSVAAAMADVQARIRKVTSAVLDRMTTYSPVSRAYTGKFHDTLISNARDLAAVLPSLNLTADPLIDDIAVRLEQGVCACTPAQLRASGAARLAVADAARAVLADLAQHR